MSDETMLAAEPVDKEKYKYDEWAVRSAVDCLMKAEEYKRDPKMMELVNKEIGKRQKELASLKDLRAKKAEVDDKATKKAYGKDDESDDA
ncbi:MAG: hypothetical protein HC841_00015 [Verrucomicrobiae bacterium]|nr:hypothetical protein [Verrucomicrobiae bacterium]